MWGSLLKLSVAVKLGGVIERVCCPLLLGLEDLLELSERHLVDLLVPGRLFLQALQPGGDLGIIAVTVIQELQWKKIEKSVTLTFIFSRLIIFVCHVTNASPLKTAFKNSHEF